jgi:hypothetical protein
MLAKQGAGLFMKSRTQQRGNSQLRIDWSGSETLRLAKTLALATALTLLLQPCNSAAFAKTNTTRSNPKIAFRLLAETKTDAEAADEKSKKDAEKSKKEAEKEKKEADKKAKEAAKVAADEAKKAKAKKDEADKEAKKVDAKADEKKADKDAKKVDDKQEAKNSAGKKDAKAAQEQADKKKKKSWFGGKGKEDAAVESEQVVEPTAATDKKVTETKPAGAAAKAPAGAAKPAAGSAAKPTTTVVTPQTTATDGAETVSEKPVLLPDKALVSVLQDISKSLSDANAEKGVETADEKMIVGLAKQILDKSLGGGEIKDNRILAPEHNNAAKTSMTTEAWASGDISISDKLRGSVATVWGKRINGLLNVTIAGDCQDKTLSNGEKVGEFIVVIKGRSPVKSGFDIQSQSDVTYWIGALNTIAVENACCRLKEQAEGEGEEASEAEPAKPADTKGEVKKKSTVVLETILTRRGIEYLQALARYQEQQQALIAQQTAEAALSDTESGTADDTDVRATGDEVKPAKVARATSDDDDRVSRRNRATDEDDDSDRVAKRARSADADDGDRRRNNDADEDDDRLSRRRSNSDDDDDRVVVKRTRSNDADDDDRVARRSKTSDDAYDDRVARRSKTSDDADDDRVARRSKTGDDADDDRVAKRTKTSSDDDGDRVVKRNRSTDEYQYDSDRQKRNRSDDDEDRVTERNKDDRDNDRARASSNADKGRETKIARTNDDDFNPGRVSQMPRQADEDKKFSSKPPQQAQSSRAIEPSWRDDWSKDGGDDTQKLATVQASSLPTSTSKPPVYSPTKEVSLTRISMASPAPAAAVSSSRSWESPAVNAAPHSPSLGATLLIPERAIAGQFLTVSVIAKDHQPERSVELSFNGATLATDLQGQVSYMIPDDMPPGHTLNIGLADRPELNPRVVDILQPLDDSTGQKAPRIDRVSQLVSADGVLVIDGHDFDGFAERNRLVIDNEQPAKVIAASPVQLRVLVPNKLNPGSHSITINSSDLRSTPAKFDFVKAEILPDDPRKTKGVLSRIVIRVQGTRQPVAVRVVNRTPDVIKISKGDNLLVTTSGGTDNSYIVGVKQLKKGDFKIDASVEI